MNSERTISAKGTEAKETRAERAIRLLTTKAANPYDKKVDEFKPFYPAVAMAMNNGMKTRQVIKVLTEGGLKLYPALLLKLMVSMAEDTETPRCPQCRQLINHPASEKPANRNSTTPPEAGAT